MTTPPRVLVFCPLNPNMPRLWGRTVQSIFRLEWDAPLDWYFVANHNPYENPYENVTLNYNRARAAVLDDGYDALFCIESDMIVPPNALTDLVHVNADVAYGLYVWRHGRRKWSAYSQVGPKSGVSLSDEPERGRAAWGKVVNVAGVGLGCTLIRRDVLEILEFRLYPEDYQFPDSPNLRPRQAFCCDWLFALDCQELGFVQKAHLGVVCGHQAYKPWPQILWPDPAAEKLYTIESLSPLPLAAEGEKVKMHVGLGTNIVYGLQKEAKNG